MLRIYESKCDQLLIELSEANTELNNNKRLMIGFTQQQEEKEEKIKYLSTDLQLKTAEADELTLKLGSMSIHYEKAKENIMTTTT